MKLGVLPKTMAQRVRTRRPFTCLTVRWSSARITAMRQFITAPSVPGPLRPRTAYRKQIPLLAFNPVRYLVGKGASSTRRRPPEYIRGLQIKG